MFLKMKNLSKIPPKKKLILLSGIALFLQVAFFRDYVSPFQWGQVKMNGQSCTCPNGNVISGQLYLWAITPDSLQKYDFDYSEIYLTEQPTTDIDVMGADAYIIKGAIIGKQRISEASLWNPIFRVDTFKEVDFFIDWAVKIFIGSQLLIWLINWYDYTRDKG
jgi:hypothetical protein